ncbi:MAG: cohesin domain-containing protein, partial [Clostridiales bacterium]|nr:cohesin domain-containing protein [Clostridiales bacterium]
NVADGVELGAIIPGTAYQKIYLTSAKDGKAGRLSYVKPTPVVEHFADLDVITQLTAPVRTTANMGTRPSSTISISGDGNLRVTSAQATWCEARVIGSHRTTAITNLMAEIDRPIDGRLLYLSEPLTERLLLSGTVVVRLHAAPDKGFGNLSAALVEIGRQTRPETGRRAGSAATSTANGTVSRTYGGGSSTSLTATAYANLASQTGNICNWKYVTWGYADVQNPDPAGKAWFEMESQNYIPNFYFQTTKIVPNQYYDYTIEMEPYNYTFEPGMRLGILVFGTDVDYSQLLTPECTAEFDVQLGEGSYAMIPLKLDEPDGITIAVADVLAAPGGTVDVTYSIKGNESGFSALDLKIPYDSAVYTPVGVTAAAALATPFFVFNPAFAAGMMRIAFVAEDNVFGNDILFTVKYQVSAAAPGTGDFPLNVEPVKMQYGGFMDKLVDLDVAVKPGTLVIGLLGDINGDGFVTPEDAMLVLQMLVGLIDWTPRALLLGDINGDGVVDTTDAALILRMVVGG